MDSVLEATAYRIKSFDDETNADALKSDLEYAANNIFNQESKAQLISNKFIHTLFSLFDSDSLSSDHFVFILQIIQKLAVLLSARTIIITTYIPNIAKLLKSTHQSVRLNACKLLQTICLFEDSVHRVSYSQITDILYDLLLNDELQTLAVLSLIKTKQTTPENVICKLIEILSKSDKFDANIRCDDTLKILTNICATQQIEIVIKENGIKSLSKFLSTAYAKKEEIVCRSTSALLMLISVCENGKESLLSNKAIIASLCYLVSNKSIDSIIWRNAGITLQNVCDHPKGLLVVGKELIHKHAVIIDLFQNDKAAKIGFAYMQHENALIQQSAIQILALIIQQNNGIDSVLKCLNILSELIDIFMTNKKERTMALALDCIIMMCQRNKTQQIILRKEARRNNAFYQNAKKIKELKAFLTDDLM